MWHLYARFSGRGQNVLDRKPTKKRRFATLAGNLCRCTGYDKLLTPCRRQKTSASQKPNAKLVEQEIFMAHDNRYTGQKFEVVAIASYGPTASRK